MSVDAVDVCATLRAAASCDTNQCIEIVCWQQIGASATPCPTIINADFDAVAHVMDLHLNTYPVPNECSDDQTVKWGIYTYIQDEDIHRNGCTSWQPIDESAFYYAAVFATEPECSDPPSGVRFRQRASEQ